MQIVHSSRHSFPGKHGRAAGLLCCAFGLLLLSCSSWLGSSGWEPVPLTDNMIRQYRISHPDLTQLQLYLDRALVLEGSDSRNEYQINKTHDMETRDTKTRETIILQENLPGKCVEYLPAHRPIAWLPSLRRLGFNWEPARLRVNFDPEQLAFLVFTPNAKGEFALEFEPGRSQVEYGGKTYTCQEGCGDRVLIIYIKKDVNEESIKNELPGNPFEDDR